MDRPLSKNMENFAKFSKAHYIIIATVNISCVAQRSPTTIISIRHVDYLGSFFQFSLLMVKLASGEIFAMNIPKNKKSAPIS